MFLGVGAEGFFNHFTMSLKHISPYSTEKRESTRMKSTQIIEMYMANARILRWSFPLQILVFALGVTQILEVLDTNMFVFPTQNFALGV